MIEELLKKLTLEEKIDMIHGAGLFRTKAVPRLGIPALKFSDGPMGVRNEFEDDKWLEIGNSDDFVSYLPCNTALASTWNRELAWKAGEVLGAEARGRGKDVILAPGINIKRSPLCGRNFEYMSEDPYLCGEIAVPLIQGIQKSDVAACVKHFALNNQETERLWVEAEADERTVREIYLPAFEKAVKEGKSLSLMGAYNKYRGAHCCESQELLDQILRGEWGYDGMVVSDWGAVHNTAAAAAAALDIEMSVTDDFDQYCMANPLKEAVERKEIDISLLDNKVRNILRMMERLHMLETGAQSASEKLLCNADRAAENEADRNQAGKQGNNLEIADAQENILKEKPVLRNREISGRMRKKGCYNTPEHRQALLKAARESVILLKNEAKRLPLKEEQVKKVLVIGENANRLHSCGGGSAEIKALYEISPLMGIKKLLGGNAEVTYVPGYLADDCEKETAINWQADSLKDGGGNTKKKQHDVPALEERRSDMQEKLRKEAVHLAGDLSYDTVILVGGQNHQQDLEGNDRADMILPYEQDVLIDAVLEVRPDTVLVLVSGSPVEMPWIDRVRTLVWLSYAGMEGGTALAEVLFGRVNPSGRLAETFPISHRDCPAHCIGEFPGTETVKYSEGIFVGYRHYDTRQIPVLFPFGYGLSYTEFVYSDMKIEGIACAGMDQRTEPGCTENGWKAEEGCTEKSQKTKAGCTESRQRYGDRPAYSNSSLVRISLDVTNTGSCAGKETVQIYVGKADSAVERAAKELKAFEKIALEPGETKRLIFSLDRNAFTYYDVNTKKFEVEPGIYQICACRNVSEICQSICYLFDEAAPDAKERRKSLL